MIAAHFESLLARLDPDRNQAADRYEELRWRLVRLFRWERADEPEHLADETLDRLARRLADGEAVERIESYLYGIARLVLREEAARAAKSKVKLAEFAHIHHMRSLPADGSLAARLEHCLAALPAEQRDLVLSYYEGEGGGRIARREALAARLGLHLNALRNRALRLREKLERCVMFAANRSPGGEGRP